jgi:predicted Rossmann-fold nucleotide-binding protein
LTLIQTHKMNKRMPVILYGEDFWKEIVNFDALVRWGTISAEDLDLFHLCSTPEGAFEHLKTELNRIYLEPEPDAGVD